MRVPPTCRLCASPSWRCACPCLLAGHTVFFNTTSPNMRATCGGQKIYLHGCANVWAERPSAQRGSGRAERITPARCRHTTPAVRTPDGLRSPVQSRRALLVSSCQLVRVRASTIECPSMTAVCAIRDDPKIARFHVSPRGARKRSKKLGPEGQHS